MEYRGEKVIDKLSVFIKPWDKTIPDCWCMLFLTTDHLYVSEKNYDNNTYTDHMTLPLSRVLGIGIEQPYMDSITDNKGLANAAGVIKDIRTIQLGLGGSLNRGFKRLANRSVGYDSDSRKREKYLTLHYRNEEGGSEVVHFSQYDFGTSKFIRKCNNAVRSANFKS